MRNYCFLTGDSLWFVGAVDNYAYRSEHIYVAPDATKYTVLCVKRKNKEHALEDWNKLQANTEQVDVKFIAL